MKLTIFGIPVPKNSQKMTRSGIVYQTPKVKQEAQNIRAQVLGQIPESHNLIESPIKAQVQFVFPLPKSMTKLELRARAAQENWYKGKKPDLDNLLKNLWDAMEGVVFLNDAQIVEIQAKKIYGKIPRIEVLLEEI